MNPPTLDLVQARQVLAAQPFSVLIGARLTEFADHTATLLRARADVVRAGRTRVVCRCDLLVVDEAGAETLCALAQGTISIP